MNKFPALLALGLVCVIALPQVSAWHTGWCPPWWIGDGWCDERWNCNKEVINNNAAYRSYDGGDCCAPTNWLYQARGATWWNYWIGWWHGMKCRDPEVYEPQLSSWSACSAACGGGTRTRQVDCIQLATGNSVDLSNCPEITDPSSTTETRSCNTQACPDPDAQPAQLPPFMRPCPSTCSESMKGDGQCDNACNNPYCGFDNGDCSPVPAGETHVPGKTNNDPRNIETNPLVCWDPDYAPKFGNFRVDYSQPQCRHHVRNQGGCGSCWAFAVSTMAHYQACHAGVVNMTFSPQHMTSCYGSPFTGGVGRGCSGGYLRVLAAWTLKGMRSEACYPYMQAGDPLGHFEASSSAYSCQAAYDKGMELDPACNAESDTIHIDVKDGSPWYSAQYTRPCGAYKESRIAMLKGMLDNRGAGVLAYAVYSDFSQRQYHRKGPVDAYGIPNSGAYRRGGHLVALTGYGHYNKTDGTTVRFWVMENSWGQNWGDMGSFYLNAEVDFCSTIWGYFGYNGNTAAYTQDDIISVSNTYGAQNVEGYDAWARRHLMSADAMATEPMMRTDVPYKEAVAQAKERRLQQASAQIEAMGRTGTKYDWVAAYRAAQAEGKTRRSMQMDNLGDDLDYSDPGNETDIPEMEMAQLTDGDDARVETNTTAQADDDEEEEGMQMALEMNGGMGLDFGVPVAVDNCGEQEEIARYIRQALPLVEQGVNSLTGGRNTLKIQAHQIVECDSQVVSGNNYFIALNVRFMDGDEELVNRNLNITIGVPECRELEENCNAPGRVPQFEVKIDDIGEPIDFESILCRTAENANAVDEFGDACPGSTNRGPSSGDAQATGGVTINVGDNNSGSIVIGDKTSGDTTHPSTDKATPSGAHATPTPSPDSSDDDDDDDDDIEYGKLFGVIFAGGVGVTIFYFLVKYALSVCQPQGQTVTQVASTKV